MSHFAEINKDNIVLRIIVAEQDFIDSGAVGEPKNWIQTSYNTFAGKHKYGGTPIKKNYAGVGYMYDATRDAFIPPKPANSWILNEDTCIWEAPIPYPTDGKDYAWNEELTCWEAI